MLNVFIDPNDSLPLLAVMLKIGSLRFVDCMLPSGSLSKPVSVVFDDSLCTFATIMIIDSL